MSSQPRILIVDDDPAVLRSLETTLGLDGYDIMTREDGESALDCMKDQPFNLVLTDIRMDGIDGFQVLEATKRLYPQTAVMLITGYGSTESAVEALRKAAIDYITKPWQVEELRFRVREALERQALGEQKQAGDRGDPAHLLGICMYCNRVRDGEGPWISLDRFLDARLKTETNAGACPDCVKNYFGREPERQPAKT